MNPQLGVCIDHLAALRNSGGKDSIDLIFAAQMIGAAGAHQVMVHLREDQSWVTFDDAKAIREKLAATQTEFILAITPSAKLLSLALKLKPQSVCLVPGDKKWDQGKRTLDLVKESRKLKKVLTPLKKSQIQMSALIPPQAKFVRAAAELGLDAIEIDSSLFAKSKESQIQKEVEKLHFTAELAKKLNLKVQVGGGLTCENVRRLVEFASKDGSPLFDEYHLGHSVIARGVIYGLERSVRAAVSAVLAP